jgi:trehalose 6-phosphate synthase
MSVARALRGLGVEKDIGFFLNTPFPPLDIFMKLPWKFQILRSLLSYDLIGFQTLRDPRNFIQCMRTLSREVSVRGKGQVIALRFGDRNVRVGAFPISIDLKEFARLASTKEVKERVWHIRRHLPNVQIILGIDRLDYTKGIPERLKAFRNALHVLESRYPQRDSQGRRNNRGFSHRF